MKLETGMHRLGFVESEIEDLVDRLKDQSSLKVATIFSHLAASDDPRESEFTQSQIALLNSMGKRIEENRHNQARKRQEEKERDERREKETEKRGTPNREQ